MKEELRIIRQAAERANGVARNGEQIRAILAALDRLEAQPRVRYRSKVSGLWYETLEAAGDVDCVEVDGVGFCQENGAECLTSQQQPKRLTDEELHRMSEQHARGLMDQGLPRHLAEARAIGWRDGMKECRDHGYIGGLSVEEVEKAVIACAESASSLSSSLIYIELSDLRARLTAKLNGTNE